MPRGPRRAPIGAVFAVHGFVGGSWAARVPWVQDHLDLSPGALGLALLGLAAGGVAALPAAGPLVARLGSRRATGLGIATYAAALALPAAAPSLPLLAGALLLLGAIGSTADVAMNAHAVVIERAMGRPILSGLHARFSLGALGGAALGGLVAGDVPAPAHLAAVAIALAVVGGSAAAQLSAGSASVPAEPIFAVPPRDTLPLGLIAFAALLAEGAAADWSAVYLDRDAGASAGLAAGGFAAFALAMAAGRLGGDRMVAAFGPVALLRRLGTVGGLGLGLGLVLGGPVPAIVGFALLGLGISTGFPLAIGAAGDPRRIAAVTALGYTGWLAGPPVIGALAELTSLRWALGVVVAAALVMAAGAIALHRHAPTPT